MSVIEDYKATTPEYTELYAPDGSYISRHRLADEAKESAIKHAIQNAIPSKDWQFYEVRPPITYVGIIAAAPAGANNTGDIATDDPPLAPVGGMAENYTQTTVDISTASNTEPDIDFYRFYRSTTGPAGAKTIQGTASTPNFTGTHNPVGLNQYWFVTAVDLVGQESEFSSAIKAHQTPVAPVIGQPDASGNTFYAPHPTIYGPFFGREDLTQSDEWWIDMISVAVTATPKEGGYVEFDVPAGTAAGTYTYTPVLNDVPQPAETFTIDPQVTGPFANDAVISEEHFSSATPTVGTSKNTAALFRGQTWATVGRYTWRVVPGHDSRITITPIDGGDFLYSVDAGTPSNTYPFDVEVWDSVTSSIIYETATDGTVNPAVTV